MTPTSFLRRTLVLAGLLAAAAGSLPANAAASTEAERVALRDATWRLERSLRQHLAAVERGGAPAASRSAPKVSELEELLGVLRDAGRRLGKAEGADFVRKAVALESLLQEVERREQTGTNRSAASPWQLAASAASLDASAAATCGDAVAVATAQLAAASVAPAGELWLRHTAAVTGLTLVSTAGSDFDTVVDVYATCPAAGVQPIAHGDDELGLQARVAFHTAAGATSWIRVRGWDGAAGTATVRVEGNTTAIVGAVTNETTGQGLGSRYVFVWDAAGSFVASTITSGDGTYVVAGLGTGTFFVSTRSSWGPDGLLDELYDDLPCAGGAPEGCSPTSGAPVAVQQVTVGVDFALGHGAAISGRVRDAATSLALQDMAVGVYGSAGQWVGEAITDEAGRFSIDGLAPGVVFALAGERFYNSLYRRELYQNLSCVPSCDVTTGTPIAVLAGQTTPGIDFSLERLGAIAGTVTRVVDGSPVYFARVEVWDGQGQLRSSSYTDASGAYLAGALNAGTYFVVTNNYGWVDELYADLPCEPSCDPTTGTPVGVTLGNTTAGIDFALHRLGSISGTLTDAVTGDTITYLPYYQSSYVYAFDSGGNFAGWAYTNNGFYEITSLQAGTYYVTVTNPLYRPELYDDIPCASCDPTTGTPVTVASENDTTVDFALTPLGRIAGTVVDSVTNAPVQAFVQIWDSSGQAVRWTHSIGGVYEVVGLAAGTYYVTAVDVDFIGELYDELPCPGGPPSGCDPTTGTAVTVSLAATTSGVDFTLVRKATISGTVRDASTGFPIAFAGVRVFDGAGVQMASATADNSGSYEARGLDAGTYFVVADSYLYDAEVYDGVPCPPVSCDPTTGTGVTVALGATAGGVDFALARSGAIAGTVTTPAGAPPPYAEVALYDAAGHFFRSIYTDWQGRYQIPAEPGTWYLVAWAGSDYVPQLYSGIPCPGGTCSVTTGTPVTVTAGATTAGVDFTMATARGIVGRVVDGVGRPLTGVAVDLWSLAGSHVDAGVTGPDGFYQLLADPGTYYVSTDSGMGAVEEIWDDVPCPLGSAYEGRCDPTTGDAVTLSSWDSLVAGVDFALEGVDLFVTGFEANDETWSAWSP